MIRRALLTIAFAATTFATPPVLAADAEWQNHFADAMRSLRRRDFVASEDACRAAIEGAEAEGVTGQRHESLLLALATVLTRQSKFEDAASTYERVIRLRSERIGDDHPELAQLLLDAAIARSAAGEPDTARTLAERAISIREQHYGAEHARVIDALAVAAMIAASRDDVVSVETTLLRV